MTSTNEIRRSFLEYISKMFDHYEAYSQDMFGRDINQTMVLTPSRLVADSADEPYSSQAKLSLAQIYEATGRAAEAEKVLRSIIDHPTILVSKEQATIALGRLLSKSKPAEARKLLEPLRTERGPVSRAAISALSDMTR